MRCRSTGRRWRRRLLESVWVFWLRERPRLARPGTPFWTVVQTEPSPQLAQQDSAMTGSPSIEPLVDPESLRLLVYHALASGIRGIEFASSIGSTPTTSGAEFVRSPSLNLELELMEPWGAAGSIAGSATCADPNALSCFRPRPLD